MHGLADGARMVCDALGRGPACPIIGARPKPNAGLRAYLALRCSPACEHLHTTRPSAQAVQDACLRECVCHQVLAPNIEHLRGVFKHAGVRRRGCACASLANIRASISGTGCFWRVLLDRPKQCTCCASKGWPKAQAHIPLSGASRHPLAPHL